MRGRNDNHPAGLAKGAAVWALLTFLLCWALAPGRAEAQQQASPKELDETNLVTMMDDVIKYYGDTRTMDSTIVTMLSTYEKDKEKLEYRKLRFLFDTHQKVTTSLNNLIDVLYIYLKLGNRQDAEVNEYIYSRSKNIITFLNNMVYFLTVRNQEIELGASVDVQKLYENYLVRLTTLLYELNKTLAHFHK